MSLVLREGLSFCLVSGRPIFLDVHQDRYFLLGGRAETEFLDLLAASGRKEDEQARCASLMTAGVLRDSVDASPFTASAQPMKAASVALAVDRASSPSSICSAALNLVVASTRLRWRSLLSNLNDIERCKAAIENEPSGNAEPFLQEVVAGFRACGLVFAPLDKCLLRSLALMRCLLRRGYRPRLVMGVMLRPFAAHCWVEHGSWILNDSAENVRTFTPILTV